MIANKTAIFTIFSTVCDTGGNRLICVDNHNTEPIFCHVIIHDRLKNVIFA